MQPRLAFAIVVAGILASQQAAAAGFRAAVREEAREREAKTACLSGDYVKGVTILAELFVETEDPMFLFNQGRCYQQNVRYVEAAERFREYLRKARHLTSKDKALADQHIADCEAAAARNQPRVVADVPPAPPPLAGAPVPASPPPQETAAQPTTPLTVSPVPAAAPITQPWQHTAKWIATGAGVVFLGIGSVEYARYYSKNRDYNNDPKCYVGGQCKALADSADTAQIVAFVGFGAAAVAAGLAITFWATDSPRTPSPQHAGVSISCAPAGAGAACSGWF